MLAHEPGTTLKDIARRDLEKLRDRAKRSAIGGSGWTTRAPLGRGPD